MRKVKQDMNQWREDALRDYVRERMTPEQFAEHIGIKRNAVYEILNGGWKRAKRPEGFMYPWPEHAPEAQRQRKHQALVEYIAERMTPAQFAARNGLNQETAYTILNGKAWFDVERPEGFVYPWPERTQKAHRVCSPEEIAEGLALQRMNGWGRDQLAEYMNVHPTTVSRWLRQRRAEKADAVLSAQTLSYFLEDLGDCADADRQAVQQALIAMLGHSHPTVREGALYGLAKTLDGQSVDDAMAKIRRHLDAAQEPSPGVRVVAKDLVARYRPSWFTDSRGYDQARENPPVVVNGVVISAVRSKDGA